MKWMVVCACVVAAAGWTSLSGSVDSTKERANAPVHEGRGPASVVRAQSFVLEDADGTPRGRLCYESGRIVLQADGSDPKAAMRLELSSGETPYLTVYSPSHPAMVRIVTERNALVTAGYRKTEGFPGLVLGINSGQPTVALNDKGGTRSLWAILADRAELLFFDDKAKLLWEIPPAQENEGD